jgi:hypothetical protein
MEPVVNAEDFKALADRAATVEGRRDHRLVEVHDRIQRANRRRQSATVAASVIAVVLALTTGAAIVALTDNDRTPPANPPRPTDTPTVVDAPSVRRLTYAEGRTIHWGDRTIDVGGEVGNVGATDDGVVFTRSGPGQESSNCNVGPGCFGALWFTDGSTTVRIGHASGTRIRGYQVEFSTAGSTVVWFEPDSNARTLNPAYGVGGEYVVYDTGERREVARFGSGQSHIQGVYDDYVYWTPDDKRWCLDFSRYYPPCRRYKGIMRLDASTGIQTEVPWAAYMSDRRSRPRMFSRPIRGEANTPGPVYDDTINFLREGNHLVADDGGGVVVTARVASTGEPVRLRLATGYPEVDDFFMIAWLDDNRVALQADNDNSLLVCRLPSGLCRTVVKGPVLADFGGRG